MSASATETDEHRQAECDRQPGRRFAGGPDAGRDESAGDAGPERRPERIRQRQRARRRTLAGRRRLAKDDEGQRRIGKAHPEPGQPERRDGDEPRDVLVEDEEEGGKAGGGDREPGRDEPVRRPA